MDLGASYVVALGVARLLTKFANHDALHLENCALWTSWLASTSTLQVLLTTRDIPASAFCFGPSSLLPCVRPHRASHGTHRSSPFACSVVRRRLQGLRGNTIVAPMWAHRAPHAQSRRNVALLRMASDIARNTPTRWKASPFAVRPAPGRSALTRRLPGYRVAAKRTSATMARCIVRRISPK